MRFAILKDNVAVNVVEANKKLEDHWIESDTVNIGDIWDGSVFTTPEKPVVSLVPESVTMRQARLALIESGKFNTLSELNTGINTIITGLPEPDSSKAQIEWDYSSRVERDKPFVLSIAPALGLSDLDLDNLFILAGTL